VGLAVGTIVEIAVAVGAVVGVDIGVSSAPQALARNRVNRPNDAAETLKLGLNLIDRMILLHQNVNPEYQTQVYSGLCGQKPVFETGSKA
jgi:hypothetical protein